MNSSYQVSFLICTALSIAGLILTTILKPTRRRVSFG
jgi:hypothetical protein